jgi:hypothetical protein
MPPSTGAGPSFTPSGARSSDLLLEQQEASNIWPGRRPAVWGGIPAVLFSSPEPITAPDPWLPHASRAEAHGEVGHLSRSGKGGSPVSFRLQICPVETRPYRNLKSLRRRDSSWTLLSVRA